MSPITAALLLVACITHGLISPFQVTCDPIIEWQGGPMVYRTTLKNVSRGDVEIQFFESARLAEIRSPSDPALRIGQLLVGSHIGDSPPPLLPRLLEPGESISKTRVYYTLQATQAPNFPAKLKAVWHVQYRFVSAKEPKKWCTAEVIRPFAPRRIKPTTAEIERFMKTNPPIEWMVGTDKVEFLPALAERVNERDDAISAMYSIADRAKLPTDTVPKRLFLGPNVRSGGLLLFERWQDKESPGSPLPTKELIAELSRAPNGWVRLLAWATFPDDVRETPAELKKVPELMLPAPTPAVAALVKELDDPAFKVREEASKKLVGLANEVDDLEPMLHHVLARPGTAELHQRVRQVLESLPKPRKRATTAEHVLSVIDRLETPRGLQLLDAVAAGPDGLPATLYARLALKDRKEREQREKEDKDR